MFWGFGKAKLFDFIVDSVKHLDVTLRVAGGWARGYASWIDEHNCHSIDPPSSKWFTNVRNYSFGEKVERERDRRIKLNEKTLRRLTKKALQLIGELSTSSALDDGVKRAKRIHVAIGRHRERIVEIKGETRHDVISRWIDDPHSTV